MLRPPPTPPPHQPQTGFMGAGGRAGGGGGGGWGFPIFISPVRVGHAGRPAPGSWRGPATSPAGLSLPHPPLCKATLDDGEHARGRSLPRSLDLSLSLLTCLLPQAIPHSPQVLGSCCYTNWPVTNSLFPTICRTTVKACEFLLVSDLCFSALSCCRCSRRLRITAARCDHAKQTHSNLGERKP
jgi:hypothetical protein